MDSQGIVLGAQNAYSRTKELDAMPLMADFAKLNLGSILAYA